MEVLIIGAQQIWKQKNNYSFEQRVKDNQVFSQGKQLFKEEAQLSIELVKEKDSVFPLGGSLYIVIHPLLCCFVLLFLFCL